MKISAAETLFATKNLEKAKNVQGYNTVNISKAALKDSISFTGANPANVVNILADTDLATEVGNSLSTSTSGHRAPYGSRTFNSAVVQNITLGVADYALDQHRKQGKSGRPTVIIGGDTRQATRESLPLISTTLRDKGVDVLYIDKPVPTPILALAAQEEGVDIAVLMTASHNPWTDGGYNLVTKEGAIAPAEVTKQVAENMNRYAEAGKYYAKPANQAGEVKSFDPYLMYKNAVEELGFVNWNGIKDAGIGIHYDAIGGTGAYAFPQILEDFGIELKTELSSSKTGPNPVDKNLGELKETLLADKSKFKIGLANDGDADRFGIIDEKGNFITPNDVLLLTAHHLCKNKGIKGDIIRSQATSSQLDLFAKNNGLDVVQTPVGFKYIAEDIIENREHHGRDILVAGEESGGLTVNSHIPEKDGIIALLLMLDLIATEKKPLSKILTDVKKDLGTNFRAININKKFDTDEQKAKVMNDMEKIYQDSLKGKTQFGDFNIDVDRTKANRELMEKYRQGGDGIKLYFTDGSSLLIRKSGTEPIVKSYIETYHDKAGVADKSFEKLQTEVGRIFSV